MGPIPIQLPPADERVRIGAERDRGPGKNDDHPVSGNSHRGDCTPWKGTPVDANGRSPYPKPTAMKLIVTLTALAASAAFAQAGPTFEVASVKRAAAGTGPGHIPSTIGAHPGHFAMDNDPL